MTMTEQQLTAPATVLLTRLNNIQIQMIQMFSKSLRVHAHACTRKTLQFHLYICIICIDDT